jgi:hypothetical protein
MQEMLFHRDKIKNVQAWVFFMEIRECSLAETQSSSEKERQ